MQRDQRSYVYDDQHTAYPVSGHATDYPSGGYHPYESTGHYYAAPAHGVSGASDSSASPYYRSMTPSLVSANRYPASGRDPRYYGGHATGASTSSIPQSTYGTQGQYYGSQYMSGADQRGAAPLSSPQFIPTPAELATYSDYPHNLPAGVQDEYSSSMAGHPLHPLQGGPSHRPRIVTGRPRNGSSTSLSPISAQSPTGERFPCEKCGKTFSRSHDRKRHYETQHLASPIIHRCRYCDKEFSRCDPELWNRFN